MSAVAASCLLMMSALFTSGAFGKGFMHANVLNSECVDVVYSLSLCVCVCVRACMCVRAQKGWCVCGICCI